MTPSALWTRIAPLGAPLDRRRECWRYTPAGKPAVAVDVMVDTGKALDVRALKNTTLDEVREYASFLAAKARQLYGVKNACRCIGGCPCCDADVGNAQTALVVFDVAYRRCAMCGHVFVGEQPTAEALNAIFSNSEAYSEIYADPETIDVRMSQVIAPKIDWTLKVYGDLYGATPESAIDVGAGGGHFVEGLRRKGIAASGYELSASSRQCAREVFGIELDASDFLKSGSAMADLVTMWGLLEYTQEPRKFLAAARRRLSPESGMLVVEVPRYEAMGTVAQAVNPTEIARHMDPTSHVNCFSDSSLATALMKEGFKPVAAWYFGMDAYELLVQIALRLNDPSALDRLGDMIPALQAALDAGRQCDDLVLAARPFA